MFLQIDRNGKFGDGIHRILHPLPYFALRIFVCQVSSVASPILPEPEQPRRSLVVAPWWVQRWFHHVPFHHRHVMDFPGRAMYLPSLNHLPVGIQLVNFPQLVQGGLSVQGASSHCTLKAAKALLMIIRYSSVSPDHCVGTRNSMCPL